MSGARAPAPPDVRKMCARRGRKAGIETRVHAHLLEDGASLVLGHERLETAAIYSPVANERLRRFRGGRS